ncbi:hypothetical protein [Streptomyces sp. NPDC014734]|uniref:hypothetical protein n=1 Tax=Streptomyces sp. NPDC014734 TaxID=3364886 RepID=UPI0036FE4ABA
MSRTTRVPGSIARLFLRTTIATLSTLSFVVCEASPTAHADGGGVQRARLSSGPDSSGPDRGTSGPTWPMSHLRETRFRPQAGSMS